ncbi:hypothetical protein [Hafnia psychrotolerans]|uniref:Uncharacterized protein n=1 Tax=Hafnia psychrotolerans TaxID=1477018 RepID=A0ABQ1GSU5_9GAMM|nr:hypothetical protein [Hafnia psychrotolerans]GGA49696.1 hypothetical protein GCM10011328_26290 [Hafnia psychrotolerans]
MDKYIVTFIGFDSASKPTVESQSAFNFDPNLNTSIDFLRSMEEEGLEIAKSFNKLTSRVVIKNIFKL